MSKTFYSIREANRIAYVARPYLLHYDHDCMGSMPIHCASKEQAAFLAGALQFNEMAVNDLEAGLDEEEYDYASRETVKVRHWLEEQLLLAPLGTKVETREYGSLNRFWITKGPEQ